MSLRYWTGVVYEILLNLSYCRYIFTSLFFGPLSNKCDIQKTDIFSEIISSSKIATHL